MASPKPKRRWYQFSLKTLLWVMAATCSIVFVGAMACGMYCLGISHTESVMRSHVNRLAPVIQKINSGEMPSPNDANLAEFWMADVDLPLCGFGDGFVRYYVGPGGDQTIRVEFDKQKVTRIQLGE